MQVLRQSNVEGALVWKKVCWSQNQSPALDRSRLQESVAFLIGLLYILFNSELKISFRGADEGEHESLDVHFKMSMLSVSFFISLFHCLNIQGTWKSPWMYSIHENPQTLNRVTHPKCGASPGEKSSCFYCFLFFSFLAVPHGLQDLSSPTRDWSRGHGSESAES